MRRKRKRRSGLSLFAAGAIGIVLIVVFSYAAYTKFANPFASKYTIHAIFSNANGLQADSLVRIAGVNVGKVTSVSTEPGCKTATTTAAACNTADVSMEIDSGGLPIHRDATFAIRPRIFLEGNFFVDVSPGTPNAPIAKDGYTFPVGQGVEPVQLDQVLTGLQANTRKNLQTLLQQYGKAVKESGAAYNRSIQYWLPAYEYSSLVAHDALGIQPHDLSNYIAAQGTAAGAIDHNPPALKSLVTDFNTTAFAFAREQANLRATVAELPKTLSAAIPAFNALNAAFPPFRRLARALLPGVRSTGPTVDASLPFITQLRLLVQPSELRGLTHDLSPTIPALAKLTNESIPLFRNQVRPASSCVANVIIPWTHLTVPDSHFDASNGFPARQVYVEGVDYLPGLAGESRVFDANGPYIRILGVGGTLTYSLSPHLFGQSLAPLSSVQPQLPPNNARPAYNETIPCETQKAISDLSAPSGPPMSPVSSGGTGLPVGLPQLPQLPTNLPSLPAPLRRAAIARYDKAVAARQGVNQETQSANTLMNILKKTAAQDGLKVRLVPGMPK